MDLTGPSFTFVGELWVWQGDAPWTFLTLPRDLADVLTSLAGPRRGFGAIAVTATLGGTVWHTSIFPDKASGSYVLPVKKSVRAAESVEAGDRVEVTLGIPPPS